MLDYYQRVVRILPTVNRELLAVTACSTVALVAYFYAVQLFLRTRSKTQTERQKSWVLTAFSSAVMTTLSLPFTVSWYKTGEPMVGGRMADYGCCFFVAYLLCDLALGSFHYRSSISLLTGWIHHIVYVLLISLLVIPHNFSSLFALCCILELPTFLLAAGNLNPAFRNDYAFAAVFFLTRIAMHVHIAYTYAWRAYYAAGSWAPTVVLTCILPMHLIWMKDCVKGILRRRRLSVTKRTGTGTGTDTAPLHAYLLSRPLVASALDVVRARRIAFRRSRQRVLRLLHDALEKVDGEEGHPSLNGNTHANASVVNQQQQWQQEQMYVGGGGGAPRWRSIRRRVVGRIRRSLPETYGVVQIAEAVTAESTVNAEAVPVPVVS